MCEKTTALRFRHHFLITGGVLSVCTNLNHTTRMVDVGWSLFNPEDNRWVRKAGNNIARTRLENSPITFSLTVDEPILCDYISLKALLLILATAKRKSHEEYQNESPQIIPRKTLSAIQFEMIRILSLLGQRLELPSIVE